MGSRQYCDECPRYTRGCKGCQERKTRYKWDRLRLIATGRWDGQRVDPAPVQAHLDFLREHRMGTRTVARRAGVSRRALMRIAAERPRYLTYTVAEAICGVWPDGYTPPAQPIQLHPYVRWDGLDHESIREVEDGKRKLTEIGLTEQLEIYRRHRATNPKQAFTARYGVSKDVAVTLSRALRTQQQPSTREGTAA